MNEFVASNGKRIEALEDGQIAVVQPIPGSPMEHRTWAGPDDAQALREFFQAERDAELGRWRSKEHPEYVAYPKHDGSVRVVLEATGEGAYHHRDSHSDFLIGARSSVLIGAAVAREFFAAHPEPKPWHDAKPGEVWELTHDGSDSAWIVNGSGEEFFAPGALLDIDNEDITAGRRIYPEAEVD